MITPDELFVLYMCLEGFLFGIYSGIFAIYLQWTSKESRTATTIFYALCLLYILTAATIVFDLLFYTIGIRLSTLPVQLQNDLQSLAFRIGYAQGTVNGCCDFIAQCILIYRCWIVWAKNIRVIIVPSFLAIIYIVTWLVSQGAQTIIQGEVVDETWGSMLTIIDLAASLVVNALATGLIVFKILKVYLEIKATSVEQTFNSSSSTGGTKLRHILFVIIESGMALFAIQLARVVVTCVIESQAGTPPNLQIALDLIISIHEMLNGIAPTIILVRASMKLSFDDEESFNEAARSLIFNNPPSDSDSLQGVGSSSSMLPQNSESEDICFDNTPSDPNIILEVQVGSSSGTPLQERSEDT